MIPAQPIKFYLDENIPASVAAQLRQLQIDVVRCQEIGMRTADDADHLALATEQGRILVTFDQDFLTLNATGRIHTGIAFITEPKNVGVIVKSLIDLHSQRSPEQMRNRVWYV